ncbi:MAG: hypothetical protein ABIH83_02000 [Candidatus Micrarchaeota archaeon]
MAGNIESVDFSKEGIAISNNYFVDKNSSVLDILTGSGLKIKVIKTVDEFKGEETYSLTIDGDASSLGKKDVLPATFEISKEQYNTLMALCEKKKTARFPYGSITDEKKAAEEVIKNLIDEKQMYPDIKEALFPTKNYSLTKH